MKTIDKDTAKKYIYATNGRYFSAVFTKKNGEKRSIHCRIGVKKGVKGVGLKYNPDEVNNVIVKDRQKMAWRTINVDTLESLRTAGVEYKITKSNGGVIFRKDIGDYKKVYESKGWKVEEV